MSNSISLKKQACYRILNEAPGDPVKKSSGIKPIGDTNTKNKVNTTKNSGDSSKQTDHFKAGPIEQGTGVQIANWSYYIGTAVAIVATSAFAYVGLKRLKAYRLAKGLTQMDLAKEVALSYVKSKANGTIVNWATGMLDDVEKLAKDEKNQGAIQKATGLAPAEVDALLDLFGEINWPEFKKAQEYNFRQAYYLGTDSAMGKEITIQQYAIANFPMNSYAYKTAITWMPLMKLAYNDQLPLVDIKLGNDKDTERAFKKYFTSHVSDTYGPYIGLDKKQIAILSTHQENPNEKYRAAQESAWLQTQSTLHGLAKIPTAILDISLKNPKQQLVDYKLWSALQSARGKDQSQEYYIKLQFGYNMAKAMGTIPGH